MLITRTSHLSGKTTERDLDITEEQLQRYLNGEGLIQTVFPNLSASDREFIMTGITDEEWDEAFLDDEDK